MKKVKLFLSVLMIVLALMLIGGATMAPAVQLKAMSLKTADNGVNGKLRGTLLFDNQGRYMTDLKSLQDSVSKATIYQFFGHDWRIVYLNQEQKVATFWMADPYATSTFNMVTNASDLILNDGSNIWSNGYSGADWHNSDKSGSLGSSVVRKALADKAATMKSKYSYFNDKVRSGAVVGTNEVATQQVIPYFAWCYTVNTDGTFSKFSKDTDGSPSNRLTAKYGLDNSDALWLPSIHEINQWLAPWSDKNKKNIMGWTITKVASSTWLRTPDYQEPGDACYAATVSSNGELEFQYINQNLGVRPAIHLNIANIESEYEAYSSDNPAKNDNWWSDDWLKALFMTVCILGVLGISFVIFAVVTKARKTK